MNANTSPSRSPGHGVERSTLTRDGTPFWTMNLDGVHPQLQSKPLWGSTS